MKFRAFTFLELILSLTILGILAAAVVPSTKKIVKRQKEVELKRALLEVRDAIDRFKKASDEGLIIAGGVEQLGYPQDFDQLVAGAPLKKDRDRNMRFLRRIPTDPITGETQWGMRSVQDSPDDRSWGGENLFDIFSLSDGTALDGTEYSTW